MNPDTLPKPVPTVRRRLPRLRVLQRRARQSLGRNDPCLCGSGRKYKRCCLPKDKVHA